MKNLRVLILSGLLTGSVVIAGTPAMADGHKEEREYPGLHKGWENHPGLHKGWEKNHHGWEKGDNDDDDRYAPHYRHDAYYGRPYGYRDRYYRHHIDYHKRTHPSMEVHNGVRDVRAARQGNLAQNRLQLKNNVQQLKKDRTELRKDIRSRASRTEIAQDRTVIRQDRQNVSDSKKEVRQSRKDLKVAR